MNEALQPQPGYAYGSSKTYVHSVGLSCCFRQWRAKSHCRFLHGYALQVKVEFETSTLDQNNWAVDFGGLKPFKAWLEETFDHKTLVAEDDPALPMFKAMADSWSTRLGFQDIDIGVGPLIQLRVVKSVGVEAFSRMIFDWLEEWLPQNGYQHVTLMKVSINEHDANGAWYGRSHPTFNVHPVISADTGARDTLSRQEIQQLIDRSINMREQSRSRTGI